MTEEQEPAPEGSNPVPEPLRRGGRRAGAGRKPKPIERLLKARDHLDDRLESAKDGSIEGIIRSQKMIEERLKELGYCEGGEGAAPIDLHEVMKEVTRRIREDPTHGAVEATEPDYLGGIQAAPCAGCASKETENIMLRSALFRLGGKAPNLVLAELGLVPETARAIPAAAAPPVDTTSDEEAQGPELESEGVVTREDNTPLSAPAAARALLLAGKHPPAELVQSLTSNEIDTLTREFRVKLQWSDGDPDSPHERRERRERRVF